MPGQTQPSSGKSLGKRATATSIMLTLSLAAGSCLVAEETPAARFINFAPGGWNPSEWVSVRMVNQQEPRTFTQKAESVGVTTASFQADDYAKERDNALLVYDTGTAEGEIEVAFGMGPGFRPNSYSCPGICLFPVVRDGVMESGISVFVAASRMAIWFQYAEGNVTRYAHLGQLARWTDPAKRHVLRCRYSKKQKSIALQLDDSDVLVFQFVGNPRLSYLRDEIGSKIAIWGCHGACDFYQVRVTEGGSLPFFVPSPPGTEKSPGLEKPK